MATGSYLGSYGTFQAPERDQGVHLLSADSLVGDELLFETRHEDGKTSVVLSNRFGGEIGMLDAKTAHDVQLCQAKGWIVHVLLASVYAKQAGEGVRVGHWGEVVLMAYSSEHAKAFDVFTRNMSQLLGEGIRPEVDLLQSSVSQVIESGGSWQPNGRRAAVAKDGNVLVKGQLSMNDKLVEQARKRNPGCMVAGWAFIVLVVFLAGYLVKTLFGL